jgi:acetyltransferase-like isoleucine patch superfamily enzyme
MITKRLMKKIILFFKKINIDLKSDINLSSISKNSKNIIIRNSKLNIKELGDNAFIENSNLYGKIRLGKFVSISGPGTVIHSQINEIIIKSFTSIAPNVSIFEFNHDISMLSSSTLLYWNKNSIEDFVVSKGRIIIEEDVWIGANVVILSNVIIGRGSVVAAGSVVNKDVARYSIVGGNTAKTIKMRFNQKQINFLEHSKWWEKDIESIKKISNIFKEKYGEGIYNEK